MPPSAVKSGNGADCFCRQCGKGAFPSHPDDGTDDDFRPFPLVVATGVGANGNRSLGTGVVGGMFIGTLALLFIVPVLFISFQWLQERLRPAQSVPTSDWQIEEEMKVSRKEIEESH